MAACGLAGAGRGGGGAFQSWVKPEVDPPICCALPRDLKLGRDIVSHVPFFSREAASEDVDEVAACGLAGAGRGGGGAFQSWVKPEVDPPIGSAH